MVRGVERVCNFDGQIEDSFHFHRLATDAVLQRHTVQIFHGDEGLPVLFADLVNGADALMIECGGLLGLINAETGQVDSAKIICPVTRLIRS